ncbi:MAG: SLBB domain-containing protein [Bacteroidetes bacterium]|nr:SLBB domain-containing protein [Bacteroidota bacterium]
MNLKSVFVGLIIFLSSFGQSFSQDSDESSSRSSSLMSMMPSMGTISITVGGEFPVTGTFIASPTERVDQFVTRMVATLSKEFKNPWLSGDDNAIAKRGIQIKRADGSVIQIDLLKYRLTGDLKLNPYLKNDDLILFPKANLEKNFITISGAVVKQGKFQFVEGDNVSDILKLAMGFDPVYPKIEFIEISSLSDDGNIEVKTSIPAAGDQLLKRGDRIRVVAAETFKKDYKVLVLGEVEKPGFVFITKNTTSISDVLKKAGGIKETGSLRFAKLLSGSTAANIVKKSVEENKLTYDQWYLGPAYNYLQFEPMANLMEMQRMSSLTNEDTIFFAIDNQLRMMQQNDFADLSKVNNSESEVAKTIIQDGDVIIIPKAPTTVYVFGQVGRTGNIPFVEGKKLDYYLDQAGGLGEEATEDIYLITGKSKQWINISLINHDIEPGDYIWVSKQIKRPFSYYMTVTASVASVVGSVATVILLIVQLGK